MQARELDMSRVGGVCPFSGEFGGEVRLSCGFSDNGVMQMNGTSSDIVVVNAK